jgi:FixJ family two-component response regulator
MSIYRWLKFEGDNVLFPSPSNDWSLCSRPPSVRAAHVAIVDDDEALCRSLVDLMHSVGYHAEPFASAEALLMSSELPLFSCVIADVHMPGMGGLNLVRKLQEQGVTTPVILTTAFPDRHLDDEAVMVGAQCLLRKPFEAAILIIYVARSFSVNALQGKINISAFASPSRLDDRWRLSPFEFAVRPRPRRPLRSDRSDRRCECWANLMAAAQRGEGAAYELLLRELDIWLRRYYARRLPRPAAEDARQDALSAIHVKLRTYTPLKSFGTWASAIARHKRIDRVRNASRFAALPLHEEMPIEDHGPAAMSAVSSMNCLVN